MKGRDLIDVSGTNLGHESLHKKLRTREISEKQNLLLWKLKSEGNFFLPLLFCTNITNFFDFQFILVLFYHFFRCLYFLERSSCIAISKCIIFQGEVT